MMRLKSTSAEIPDNLQSKFPGKLEIFVALARCRVASAEWRRMRSNRSGSLNESRILKSTDFRGRRWSGPSAKCDFRHFPTTVIAIFCEILNELFNGGEMRIALNFLITLCLLIPAFSQTLKQILIENPEMAKNRLDQSRISLTHISDVLQKGEFTDQQIHNVLKYFPELNRKEIFDGFLNSYRPEKRLSRKTFYEPLVRLDVGLAVDGLNGSFLGEVLERIGDFNGDGYEDWAIGLPRATDYLTNENAGKVYLYLGSSKLTNEQKPAFVLKGEESRDEFGSALAGGGDINGDGYDDLIIGAPYANYSSSQLGGAYIVFGGKYHENDYDRKLYFGEYWNVIGKSISINGDLNNDGFNDIVVSCGYAIAFIFWGGEEISDYPDVVLEPHTTSSYIGSATDILGDINGDGYDDIGISLPYLENGETSVFLGGQSINIQPDYTISGMNSEDDFGEVLTAAGDINGDGYSDFLIGSDNYNNELFLFYGDSLLNQMSYTELLSQTPGSFQNGVSAIGDLNKDGFGDIAVGVEAPSEYGQVNIYLGKHEALSSPDYSIVSDQIQDRFARTIVADIDVNGDHEMDILIGAPYNSETAHFAGRVHLYLGNILKDQSRDYFFSGKRANSAFGSAMTGGGDINGDGFDDLIITDLKNLHIFLGSYENFRIPDLTINDLSMSPINECNFINDFNNDGYEDLIITTLGGECAVLFGSPGPTFNLESVLIPSESISSGDFNGDGISDIISASRGLVHIYFGSENPDFVADFIISWDNFDEYFGYIVSTSGDLNNDGFDDFMVGTHPEIPPGNSDLDTCKVYLFWGGTAINSEPDMIIKGQGLNDYFGSTMTCIDDYNSDGYDDIAIGTGITWDLPGLNNGYIAVYYGGDDFDSNMDEMIQLHSNISMGMFRSKLVNLGDINSDGASELCYLQDNYSNQLVVYFGMSAWSYEFIFEPAAYFEAFGSNIAQAGDYNNDGNNEILIGAIFNSAVGHEMGAAYLYQAFLSYSIPDFNGYTNTYNTEVNTQFNVTIEAYGYPLPAYELIAAPDGVIIHPTTGKIEWTPTKNQIGSHSIDIKATNENGYDEATIYVTVTDPFVGIKPDNLPKIFTLWDNYPNPFNPTTTIRYSLPTSALVTLRIYNAIGQLVDTVDLGRQASGYQTLVYNGSDLASGVYYYRIKAGKNDVTKKMVLIN
jgi:hypothetical protein